MTTQDLISKARKRFHSSLLKLGGHDVSTNADSDNLSNEIAAGVARRVGVEVGGPWLAGRGSRRQFEASCRDFVKNTFTKLQPMGRGRCIVNSSAERKFMRISNCEEYSHLAALFKLTKQYPELATVLESDYIIAPDIIITTPTKQKRAPNNLRERNRTDLGALHASVRKRSGGLLLLHASISCKWTIRSDRSQNARSEALNLIRNRKGRLPHVVVITGEPLPSRIASIALGTGDIDCVYHFALPELTETVSSIGAKDAEELLNVMITGKRLKDISDLPLDLAV